MSDVLQTLSSGLADAVSRASHSIVTVVTRRRPISGVVHSADLVLTIDHVLEGEDSATIIAPDGSKLEAQVQGRDPSTDLVLLKVNGALTPATPASGAARVGQYAMLVARPDGGPDGVMASHGVVSAVGGPLRIGRGVMLEQFVRTDATPYPGFSGGALIDVSGAVLGITNAGLARGLGLAVPAGLAWKVGAALVSGSLKRGWLGIGSQPARLPEGARAGRSQEVGLLISSVEPGSPAAQAGMLLGDVLVGFDGQVITDTDELQAMLYGPRVGQAVGVEVIRAGQLETLTLTVAERPSRRRRG